MIRAWRLNWTALGVALLIGALGSGCVSTVPPEVTPRPATPQQESSGPGGASEQPSARIEPSAVARGANAAAADEAKATPQAAQQSTPVVAPQQTSAVQQPTPGPTPAAVPTASNSVARAARAPSDQRVEELLRKMSLEQKVGQVFMVGITGTTADAETLTLLRETHLGGVILFARNTETPDQVRSMTAALQQAASSQDHGIPLFVSIDQEGGMVGRISQGVTLLPGNMALGASQDPELARESGRVLARELAAMGVNMDLAPVVDVNSNPANPVIGVRSFGSAPGQVAEFGKAFIAGLQGEGVVAVAKHFPGHGDTKDDSHYSLPVVDHARERLEQVELVPFKAAIADGVDAIMTAHVVMPALDNDRPATLSSAVLSGLLREGLGFQGLVLTDALDMAAIKERGGVAQGAVEAFNAGSDMLLVAGIERDDLVARRQAYNAVLAAAKRGEISQERLDASVRRVLAAKARRGLLEASGEAPRLSGTAAEEHRAASERMAARAVTLVRDEAGLLPLDPGQRVLVVRPISPRSSPAEEQTATGALGDAVRAVAPKTQDLVVSVQPSASDVERAVAAARSADRVILASYDAWRWPRHQALVRALLGSGTPMVVVSVRAPYDLLAMPQIPTYLAVYSDRPIALRAAADALFGKAGTPGRLPVELPGLYPLGHGIDTKR